MPDLSPDESQEPEMSEREWDEYVESISPHVMKGLEEKNFFELLDPRVFPTGDVKRSVCAHNYEKTLALIAELGFDEDETDDIVNVLQSRGGFCDCEVLFNAADGDDLPKERYWKEKAKQMKESK